MANKGSEYIYKLTNLGAPTVVLHGVWVGENNPIR